MIKRILYFGVFLSLLYVCVVSFALYKYKEHLDNKYGYNRMDEFIEYALFKYKNYPREKDILENGDILDWNNYILESITQ